MKFCVKVFVVAVFSIFGFSSSIKPSFLERFPTELTDQIILHSFFSNKNIIQNFFMRYQTPFEEQFYLDARSFFLMSFVYNRILEKKILMWNVHPLAKVSKCCAVRVEVVLRDVPVHSPFLKDIPLDLSTYVLKSLRWNLFGRLKNEGHYLYGTNIFMQRFGQFLDDTSNNICSIECLIMASEKNCNVVLFFQKNIIALQERPDDNGIAVMALNMPTIPVGLKHLLHVCRACETDELVMSQKNIVASRAMVLPHAKAISSSAFVDLCIAKGSSIVQDYE